MSKHCMLFPFDPGYVAEDNTAGENKNLPEA